MKNTRKAEAGEAMICADCCRLVFLRNNTWHHFSTDIVFSLKITFIFNQITSSVSICFTKITEGFLIWTELMLHVRLPFVFIPPRRMITSYRKLYTKGKTVVTDKFFSLTKIMLFSFCDLMLLPPDGLFKLATFSQMVNVHSRKSSLEFQTIFR